MEEEEEDEGGVPAIGMDLGVEDVRGMDVCEWPPRSRQHSNEPAATGAAATSISCMFFVHVRVYLYALVRRDLATQAG